MSAIIIRTPDSFNFEKTVASHGWYDLPPFKKEEGESSLRTVISPRPNKNIFIQIAPAPSSVVVRSLNGHMDEKSKSAVRSIVRSMLRMDESFDDFYTLCRKEPHLRWVPRKKAGRLLRSPTLFEDVVKMMFTTNCSWALTRIMTVNITTKLGSKVDEGIYGFPTPESVARKTEQWLRKEISCGYRAPYLLELCRTISDGKLELEPFRDSTASTEELYESLRSIKGIGHYAAGNLLKLLGRYDYLGIDSWIRKKFSLVHKNGRKVSDTTIEKHYHRYGTWRGLVCWMEATGNGQV